MKHGIAVISIAVMEELTTLLGENNVIHYVYKMTVRLTEVCDLRMVYIENVPDDLATILVLRYNIKCEDIDSIPLEKSFVVFYPDDDMFVHFDMIE